MSKTRKLLLSGAAVAGLALGGAALAGAATSGSTGSTGSAGGGPPHGAPQFNNMPAPGSASHEDAEKSVTGDAMTKAQSAAVKATGGGTAGDVTTTFRGGGYEVTVTKSDGTKVEVHLDSSFNVMPGPGGPPQGARGANGPGPQAGAPQGAGPQGAGPQGGAAAN